MEIRTMTINQTLKRLRELGIKTTSSKLGDCIEQGRYPFGICIKGKQKRWFEIYEADFEKWVQDRIVGHYDASYEPKECQQ